MDCLARFVDREHGRTFPDPTVFLSIGNIEMDYDHGEVRLRTGIDVEGDELSQALVRNIGYTNVMMADRLYAGLPSVIYSDTSPAEPLALIAQSTLRHSLNPRIKPFTSTLTF